MGRDSLGKGIADHAGSARLAPRPDPEQSQATQDRYESPDLDVDDGLHRDPLDSPARPSLADLDALSEPVFPAEAVLSPNWLDSGGVAGSSLADHPLLRGLLLELPPKGSAPAPDWLDRWFDAARSILELLYAQEFQRR